MASKKEDLLTQAEILFYEHGFHSIGLKRVVSEANVAIMTLYNHFSSKEELIMEVLKRREQRYFSYLTASFAHPDKSVAELAKAHIRWLKERGSRGCMFLRAKEEFGADPANGAIVQFVNQHKQRLLEHLYRFGLDEPSALQVMLLFEGATAMAETEEIRTVERSFLALAGLIPARAF